MAIEQNWYCSLSSYICVGFAKIKLGTHIWSFGTFDYPTWTLSFPSAPRRLKRQRYLSTRRTDVSVEWCKLKKILLNISLSLKHIVFQSLSQKLQKNGGRLPDHCRFIIDFEKVLAIDSSAAFGLTDGLLFVAESNPTLSIELHHIQVEINYYCINIKRQL